MATEPGRAHLVRTVGAGRVVATCAAPLQPAAGDLLDTLVGLDAAGPRLDHGSTVEFGGTLLILRRNADGDLEVHEPDLSAAAPWTAARPGVDTTLRLILAQLAVCRLVGAEPTTTRLHDGAILAHGVLDDELMYVHRKPPVRADDSGWYVGPVEQRSAEPYERMPIWALAARAPFLLHAMALPLEYLAVFSGGALEAILDADNREVFRRPA